MDDRRNGADKKFACMRKGLLNRLEELNNDAIFQMSEAIIRDDETGLLLWNRIHLFASHYIQDIKGEDYQSRMMDRAREDGFISIIRDESPVGEDNRESVN